MLKKFSYIFALTTLTLSAIIAFVLLNPTKGKTSQKEMIAITQIAPHPSLDKIRKGILERLKKEGIHDDQILFQNAQGNPTTALQIAQKFVSLKPSVIVPITTPSAQSAYHLAKSAGIPVIFSAISDPISAKLIVPGEENALIGGVSDVPPIKEQLDLMRKLVPNLKTIGTLSSSSEANSEATLNLLENEAQKYGIHLIKAKVTSTNDVGSAAKSLIGKVDVFYIPTDNTVVSALESVIDISLKEKIPFFASDPESVEKGALACAAYDQYDIGYQTGELIVEFLKDPSVIKTMGIKKAKKISTIINQKTARAISLPIEEFLKQPSITVMNKGE